MGLSLLAILPLRNDGVKQLFSTCKLNANLDIYLSEQLCCKEDGTHIYKTAQFPYLVETLQ